MGPNGERFGPGCTLNESNGQKILIPAYSEYSTSMSPSRRNRGPSKDHQRSKRSLDRNGGYVKDDLISNFETDED